MKDRSVEKYIQQFPAGVQSILQRLRRLIHAEVPEATERIAYGIPTYTLNGNLVHFAAFKRHIGFYPTPSAIRRFEPELKKFVRAKGSVQFPLDEPIPYALIRKLVRFRIAENRRRGGRIENRN